MKTTIIGGASFLLPVAFVIFIMSYALRLVRRIAEPISHSLHLDHLVGAGVGTVTVLSVAVLVLISFAAGNDRFAVQTDDCDLQTYYPFDRMPTGLNPLH